MASLLKLPDEIICMIAEQLGIADLDNFFGTCRCLRDLPTRWVDGICRKVFQKHAFFSPEAYQARSDEAAQADNTHNYLYARAFRLYTKRRHALKSNSPFQRVWLPRLDSSAPFILEQGKLCYFRTGFHRRQLRILDLSSGAVDRELVIDLHALIRRLDVLTPGRDLHQIRPKPLHCSHDIFTLACYPTEEEDAPLILAIDLTRKDIAYWKQIVLFEEEKRLAVRNNRRFLVLGDCQDDEIYYWVCDMSRPQDDPMPFAWGYGMLQSGDTAWFEVVGQNIWGAVRHNQTRSSLDEACQYGLMKARFLDNDSTRDEAPDILDPHERPRSEDESATAECPETPGMVHFHIDEQSGTLMLSDQILIDGPDQDTRPVLFDIGGLGDSWETRIGDMVCPMLSSVPFHSKSGEGFIYHDKMVSLDYERKERNQVCVSLLSYDPSINFRGLEPEGTVSLLGTMPLVYHQPWMWEERASWRETCMGDDWFWKAP